MARKTKTKPKSSSMFPTLHEDVAILLEDCGLDFSFHNIDEEVCRKDRVTNVMGSFACRNPKCATKGWSSKLIPITIRLYDEQKYNARVYHQRCRACNWLAKPRLDESYAERIVYWLKKWSGIEVEKPHHDDKEGKGPHLKDLCEGCKVGRCTWTLRNAGTL
jgi:hypothetical protein